MKNMKNKGFLIWLDDQRDPYKNPEWLVFSPIIPDKVIWVKSYNEFVEWITKNGLPEAICFDHDLGDEHIMDFYKQKAEKPGELIQPNYSEYKEKTGYEAAKWLVEYCIETKQYLPKWNVQSANIVGKENIRSYLTNFEKYY